MFGFDIADILINIPITLLALTVHECAHGWVSYKLGDPTPKYQGRLTLNPLAHLEPMGTLLMILTGFGWAKPVQVNPRYYKNIKKGMALVAVAGPLSNFLLAVIGALLLIIISLVVIHIGIELTTGIMAPLIIFLISFIQRNLGLMIFNLVPIPPLDGSKVLGMFLPNSIYYKYMQYEQYCMILVMIL